MKHELTTGVLEKLLEPISRAFNPDSARALAQMEADPSAQARVAELAEKCNEGTLTPVEQREYETYVHAGNLIAILQAKARLYLKRHAAS
jgi:hypothetical protein